MHPTYQDTEAPADSPWAQLSPATRRRLIFVLWLITELGLLAGIFVDPRYWLGVVALNVAQAMWFLGLTRGAWVFPTQLRIAFAIWLLIGALVPSMVWMMYVPTIGLAANLIWRYCLLSRLLYLLPWNRPHALTWDGVWQIFLAPPRPGRFQLRGGIRDHGGRGHSGVAMQTESHPSTPHG